MRTILDSVRLINKKLGGTVEADEGMRSLLDEIATLFHSGGGGSGSLVVTFTENNGTWTADKTAQEIYEAFENGTAVVGRVCEVSGDGAGGTYYDNNAYPLTYTQKHGDDYSARFVRQDLNYEYSFQTLNWQSIQFNINHDWQGEHVSRYTNSWTWQE